MLDAGADADGGAVPDGHLPASGNARRDRAEVFEAVVVINASASIDDAVLADHGARIDHRTSHDDGAFAYLYIPGDDGTGMGEGGKPERRSDFPKPCDDGLPRVVVADRYAPVGIPVLLGRFARVVQNWNAVEAPPGTILVDKGYDIAARAPGNIGDDAGVLAGSEQDDVRAARSHTRFNCHIKSRLAHPRCLLQIALQ